MAVNPNNWELAQHLEQAFNQIGESMLSDDFAAKLLAFTYVIGDEVTVLHEGLNAGIAMASQKFNIKRGEIPNPVLLKGLQMRIKNLEIAVYGFDSSSTMAQLSEVLPWIKEIYTRYNLILGNEPKSRKSKGVVTEP